MAFSAVILIVNVCKMSLGHDLVGCRRICNPAKREATGLNGESSNPVWGTVAK